MMHINIIYQKQQNKGIDHRRMFINIPWMIFSSSLKDGSRYLSFQGVQTPKHIYFADILYEIVHLYINSMPLKQPQYALQLLANLFPLRVLASNTKILLKYSHKSKHIRGQTNISIVIEDESSPSIVQLFRNFLKKKDKKGKYIGLLTEYCPFGTLKQYISQKAKLTIPQAIAFSLQLTECLINLTEQGILHRDINSNNILLSDEGLKLTDFDCVFLKDYSSQQNLSVNLREKTSAPQLMEFLRLEHSQKAGMNSEQLFQKQQKCDIYSLGTVIFQMLTGQQFNLADKMSHLTDTNEQLKVLILQMLQPEYTKRINLSEIQIYLSILATKYNIYTKKRGLRQHSKVIFKLPEMMIHPSTLSNSKSNSLSLSDWSLQETPPIHPPLQPSKTPLHFSPPLPRFHKPSPHFTLNQ